MEKNPIAGVITKAGNTRENKTGDWRSLKPVVDKSKCTGCGICWRYCPDGCIPIVNKKAEVDYYYCKGCLICMEVCPVKAISSAIEKK